LCWEGESAYWLSLVDGPATASVTETQGDKDNQETSGSLQSRIPAILCPSSDSVERGVIRGCRLTAGVARGSRGKKRGSQTCNSTAVLGRASFSRLVRPMTSQRFCFCLKLSARKHHRWSLPSLVRPSTARSGVTEDATGRVRRFVFASSIRRHLPRLETMFLSLKASKSSKARSNNSINTKSKRLQASPLGHHPYNTFINHRMAQSLSPDNPHHDCRHLFYCRLHHLSGRAQRRRSRSVQFSEFASSR